MPTSPPFDGTIFIDPDIITDRDPTSCVGLVYSGQGGPTMFDRRVDGWVTIDPFGVPSLSLKSDHGETGATAPGDDDVYVVLPDVLLRTVRRDLRLRLDRLQESPGTQFRCDFPV